MRLLTILAAGTLSLLACSDDGPSGGNAPPPEGDITIGDDFYNPESFSATVGTPVVWIWTGSNLHTVTFDDGAPGSDPQASGTFQRTFTAAGAFTYFCTVHGAAVMSGVVNVAAGGSGGSGGGGDGGGGGGGGGYDY